MTPFLGAEATNCQCGEPHSPKNANAKIYLFWKEQPLTLCLYFDLKLYWVQELKIYSGAKCMNVSIVRTVICLDWDKIAELILNEPICLVLIQHLRCCCVSGHTSSASSRDRRANLCWCYRASQDDMIWSIQHTQPSSPSSHPLCWSSLATQVMIWFDILIYTIHNSFM